MNLWGPYQFKAPLISTHTHRCTQTYRHTQYAHTYIPTHTHAYIHAHTYTHHTHIYLHTHTQTYAHMHIHINTLDTWTDTHINTQREHVNPTWSLPLRNLSWRSLPPLQAPRGSIRWAEGYSQGLPYSRNCCLPLGAQHTDMNFRECGTAWDMQSGVRLR